MTVMQSSQSGGHRGSLYDVLELILDRGLVIDVFVRVSLVGIELLTIDARIVVASVDTYLRFARECNRLDLTGDSKPQKLGDLVGDTMESGAKGKSKGALTGAAEAVGDTLQKARGEKSGASSGSGTSSGSGSSGGRSRGATRSRAKEAEEQ